MRLWDLLCPPTCIHCGKDVYTQGEWCDTCLKVVMHERCIMGPKYSSLECIYILADYVGGIKTMLHDIKFNGKKERALGAAPFLQRFTVTCLDMNYMPTIVVPIPISDSKRKQRGYNQVDMLFKNWVNQQNWKWVDLLVKLDGSKPMWTLTKEERRKNMKGHFLVRSDMVSAYADKNISILLVDDIYTTGATLLEAADTIHAVLPRAKIKALTLASGA
mgnify:CR=1 FL=1